ncbi:MAG: M23 family metallopeptidase [Deltaproteobacteria bacterium]|nr:M23 family metallopeptidase [Deltaproteobacteria bacterium]
MSRYSILVIPKNHLETKRFHLSKLSVYGLILLGVFFISFTSVMTWGFMHYRQVASQNAQKTMSPGEEMYRSKLLVKINQLEESLRRTQQFATRMEASAGVNTDKLKMGVGPLHEQDDFGKYLEKISKLPKADDPELFGSTQKPELASQFYEKLGGRLEELSEYALTLETKANEIYELGQEKLSYWASTPSIWPVKGWVTSDFGGRYHPITGMPKFHEGIDIAAPYGSSIFAPSDGVASFVGYKGGYGNALILDHGYGVSTMYAHTSNILVKEGEKIKRGQLVASVGSSGAATGPHLHYEVHVDGVPTDPKRFILR